MIKSFNITYTGRESLTAILDKVAGHPAERTLAQVYSGDMNPAEIERLIVDMKELLPGVRIVGCSTAGEIAYGNAVENSVLVNFSLFGESTVRTALVRQNDDLEQAGRDLGQMLRQEGVKAVITLGCGLKDGRTINSEPLLKALDDCFEDAIIAGGQAGDNGRGKTTFVFTQDGITEDGVAAASLSGEALRAHNTYNLNWVPISKRLTITQAEDSRVYGIDDRSPYEIYQHYLGQEVVDNLPLSAVDFPMIIERDGLELAIHATGVHEDGSFSYINKFHPGEQLRFGYCHVGLLTEGVQKTTADLRRFGPQALFIFSCVSRKSVLGRDIAVELSPLADIAPSAGFYGYGEYFRRDTGRTYFFSQTMTVLALAEGPAEPKLDVSLYGHDVHESKQFRTMRVLHRLVEKSSREIEAMNVELARLANKDSLTNLSNRRRFDETLYRECRRLSRTGGPLSLLLIDVDFFKGYNDTYGHVAGDDCLRAISLVLRNQIKRPSDAAARYGGEEFACILPETNHEGALTLAEMIRQGVERLKLVHEGSKVSDRVTLSIGVLTIDSQHELNPEDVLEACDNLLYRAKEEGRNRVIGERRTVP